MTLAEFWACFNVKFPDDEIGVEDMEVKMEDLQHLIDAGVISKKEALSLQNEKR